ncbi:UNVERIFIED_CONTAM: hypothetical protein Sindi_1353800 [Sesamum indicum]
MKHHPHHPHHNDTAVSSSDAASPSTPSSPIPPPSFTRTSEKPSMPVEDPSRDASSAASLATTTASESVVVERRGDYSALCKWTIANFPKIKSRALWSKYFEVGGFDCRLLIYPKGDSQALPGYVSIYLQIMDPRNTASSKWDCFASYRLAIENLSDASKSVHRDSWHRFSSKKKSHGWCDFASLNSVLDPKVGFLHSSNDCILITADILILHESFSFSRDNYDVQANNVSTMGGGGVIGPVVGDVLSGKFTWKVHNFSLFKEMIKTQKIMSPVFPAGECNLRISVYQSVVNGVEYLSMCLESKDTEKNSLISDRSCWCLFRMSVLNHKLGGGLNHVHRDSYGRFAADNKSGDNTSLGWNDYMKMADFMGPESGFLVEDTAVFSTSFHVIKELSSFSKSGTLIGVRNGGNVRKSDGHMGKFSWRIENFTRLKDLLKKRKITGLCIKSRRFQIGNRDCRLIVYPRGQSQPPCHLSVFLEVTDSRNTNNDWSCFVSHRLSVVNQRMEDKSVTKESQNRYSKAAKDWGWREFVTLTSLFDQDSGFLVQDTVIFSAEVLILKETSIMQDFTDQDTDSGSSCSPLEKAGKRSSFTWKVENFLSFKEIMETRKIFSKFFQAGGCELRIGVYESFDTICIYLESDQAVGSDPEKNFWVKYRMAIVNQKNPAKTVWKESSICTKTWNNSVLQFMKVSDMLEADAGFLLRDTVVFVCEILDCCPWFEFSDLESEMRAEMDRVARDRKELMEQMQEVENQLEWVRSERDDEITKLKAEKKILQDRLHEAETQLSQLKSRKCDELKRVMKEKNALAERLKSAEAARRRFDEELKRFATENVTREEIRQSLEDEVRRLTQTVGQTEGEKREKEEQVARCEAYIDGMESKLQACEQYIHHLEAQFQEEMARHAPLYGVGLDALSMKELETLSRIHEEGLRQIRAIQQRKGSPAGSPLVSPHTFPHTHGLYPPTPLPMPVGLPPSLIPNGVGIHSNGHVNGGIGPWFNH